MEPERASFGNDEKDFDTLKHPTSILRPEDLARELDEANGYLSKKEEQSNDHNSETVSPEKEQDFNDKIDIEAIIGEVGDIPAGIYGGQLEEPVEIIEEFTDSQINGRDKEEKLISESGRNGEEIIDKTLFQTLDVEDDKESGTETGAKLNFIFKIINRAMVSYALRNMCNDLRQRFTLYKNFEICISILCEVTNFGQRNREECTQKYHQGGVDFRGFHFHDVWF